MTPERVDFTTFETGDVSYDELLDWLCESPGRIAEQLHDWGRQLDGTGVTLDAQPHLRDVHRLFGLPRVLDGYLSDENLAALEDIGYSSPRPSVVNLYVDTELSVLQDTLDDGRFVMMDGNKENIVDYDEHRINIFFGKSYRTATEIPSSFDNVRFSTPTRDAVLARLHDTVLARKRAIEQLEACVENSDEFEFTS